MKSSVLLAMALSVVALTLTAPGWTEETLSALVAKPLRGNASVDVTALSNDWRLAEAVVAENPGDPEAHFLLAVAYSRTPYLEKAIQELRTARKLAKKSPEGCKLFDRKIAEYERMLAGNPNDPLILYRLAFGYYMRGYGVQHGYIADAPTVADQYYEKAEQTMRRLIAVDPFDAWAHDYLGFFLVERDEANTAEAIRLWEHALTVQPDDPGAKFLLGEAYLRQGNLRKAVEYAGQALQARQQWLSRQN